MTLLARVVLALYYVFHAASDKMHRVLTVWQKLPSPCRAKMLEYLVPQRERERERGRRREGGREGGREGEMERVRERWREGGKEGERERGREGGR